MGKIVTLDNGSKWEVPDRPPVGAGRKPFKQMAEIAFVRSGDGRLFCPCCRSHFEEQHLRGEKKSLRFCSVCWGVDGVLDLLEGREEERMEVFYQLGLFERKE